MARPLKAGEVVEVLSGTYSGCTGTVETVTSHMVAVRLDRDGSLHRVKAANVKRAKSPTAVLVELPSLEDDAAGLAAQVQAMRLTPTMADSARWLKGRLEIPRAGTAEAVDRVVADIVSNLPCCGAMVAALSLKPRHIVEGSAAASRDSLGRFLLQLLDWDEAAYSAFPTTPTHEYREHRLWVADGLNVRDELVFSLRHLITLYVALSRAAPAACSPGPGPCGVPPAGGGASPCGTPAGVGPSDAAAGPDRSLPVPPVPREASAARLLREMVTATVAWHVARLRDGGMWAALSDALRGLVEGLEDDDELYLPAGWKGHVIGVCVHRCGAALVTRVDNRGQGSDTHPTHPWYATPEGGARAPKGPAVSPLLLRIDPCGSGSVSDLLEYLTAVAQLPCDGSQKANSAVIYGRAAPPQRELLARVAALGPSGRVHARRLAHRLPLQTAGNCTVATHAQGMLVRIGSLAVAVVDHQRVECLRELGRLAHPATPAYDSDKEEDEAAVGAAVEEAPPPPQQCDP